jgi:hypothetical protein
MMSYKVERLHSYVAQMVPPETGTSGEGYAPEHEYLAGPETIIPSSSSQEIYNQLYFLTFDQTVGISDSKFLFS